MGLSVGLSVALSLVLRPLTLYAVPLRKEENSRILPMEEATEQPGHFSGFLPGLREGRESLRSAHSGLGPEALSFLYFTTPVDSVPASSPSSTSSSLLSPSPQSFINFSLHQYRFIVRTEQRDKLGPQKREWGWGGVMLGKWPNRDLILQLHTLPSLEPLLCNANGRVSSHF